MLQRPVFFSLQKWFRHAKCRILDDEVAQKAVLNIFNTMGFVGGILWGCVLYNLGLTWSASAVWLLPVVCSISFALQILRKPLLWAIRSTCYPATCVFLVADLSFGSGPHSAGVSMICYFSPFLLVLCKPFNWEPLLLLMVIWLWTITFSVLQQSMGPEYLTPQGALLPSTWYTAALWFNLHASGAVYFVVTAMTMWQLRHSRWLLSRPPHYPGPWLC